MAVLMTVPTADPTGTAAARAGASGAAAEVRRLTEDLETFLGDPFRAGSRITYRRSLELDEREAYPHEELAALYEWGAHEYSVPARWGGRAEHIETSLHLMRQVARRDPTAAVALSITSLSYMTVWVAGTGEQRRYYGDLVRAGATMCWGLSERDHGSDIMASATVATPVPGGYRVSGEKWLIGNGSLADLIVVFARTGTRPGPGAFSLLVVDRRTAPAGAVQRLPDEPLHGLRGLDMSGFRLTDVFVPDSAVIGAPGRGVEIALQSGHAVRAMITSIALGCTDTALRLTLDFAANRTVFGHPVTEIPYSRRQLTEAYASLLVADAVASVACRSLQVCPEQSSVFSAVSKYWVPTLLSGTVGDLAVVLGARHYLRGDPRFGVFQKMARDLPVADFADGNTVVNLKNIALQLGSLLALGDRCADGAEVLFDLDAELPPYEPWRQALSSRGRDLAVAALTDTEARLRARAGDRSDDGSAGGSAGRSAGRSRDWSGDWAAAADVVAWFGAQRDRLAEELDGLQDRLGPRYGGSEELFGLARQYCVVHAAAAVAGVWAHTRSPLPGGGNPAVLLAALERLVQVFHPLRRVLDAAGVDAVAGAMLDQHAAGEAFSVRAARLAASPLDRLPTSADVRAAAGAR